MAIAIEHLLLQAVHAGADLAELRAERGDERARAVDVAGIDVPSGNRAARCSSNHAVSLCSAMPPRNVKVVFGKPANGAIASVTFALGFFVVGVVFFGLLIARCSS